MAHLPTAAIDQERIIEATTKQYELFGDRMSMEATLPWLESTLKDFLRQGLIETLKVIKTAEEEGDEIAHRALVCVFDEMKDPPTQLKAYVGRTAIDGPVTRKPGRYGPYDNWRRDIGIAVLVYWVASQFGLTPTRNRESRRARQPSASSIVAITLPQRNRNFREPRSKHLGRTGRGDNQLCGHAASVPINYAELMGFTNP